MKTLTSNESKKSFNNLISIANKQAVTISDWDETQAVLISTKRYQELTRLEKILYRKTAKLAIKKDYLLKKNQKNYLIVLNNTMNYRLTKQATKQLRNLKKSDIKTAIISLIKHELKWEVLQGSTDFFKIRIGKYRLIYTKINDKLIIAIIEKRETVYKTFQHLLEKSKFLDA